MARLRMTTMGNLIMMRRSLTASALILATCNGGGCGKQTTTKPSIAQPSIAATATAPAASKPLAPSETSDCKCPKIIPAQNAGIYLGAFVGDAITESNVAAFEQMTGQTLDIGLVFKAFKTGPDFPANQAEVMAKRDGAIFVKLEPWSWGGKNDQSYSLDSVIDGDHDGLLQTFARSVQSFGKPIFASFGHEMNGEWYPWSMNSQQYVAAYRHVHDVISQEACNITWVWNPNIDRGNPKPYYPGKQYVDWTAADGYNTVDYGGGWRTFNQLFSGITPHLSALNKPMMIGEFASDANSAEDRTVNKPAFIRDAIDSLVSGGSYRAFVWFNVNKSEEGQPKQWALNTPESQKAFRESLAKHSRLFEGGIRTTCGTEIKPPAAPPPSAAEAAETPSAAPAGALLFTDIAQGNFPFNGASATESNGVYTFFASKAKDPGFGIFTGNTSLAGKNTFAFEIKGKYEQHGSWTRVIAQIYKKGDSDATPTINYDPVTVKPNWSPVAVPLKGLIPEAWKVQFLLVTDNGSCNLQIRNLRFE